MKTRLSIILILAGALIAYMLNDGTAQNSTPPAITANHPAGTVVHCFDGDTFKLKDRRVVRLAGIDAPEVPHGEQKGQLYARKSRQLLRDQAQGKKITLSFPTVHPKDRFGRLVAEAFLENGQSLNASLIEEGAAFFYPHQDLNPEFQEKLKRLQAIAIHEKRGMWEELLSQPFAQEPYIGNRQSLRFFPVDCPELQNIKPRNKVHFGNLMDAFLAGYAPARICIFWPTE